MHTNTLDLLYSGVAGEISAQYRPATSPTTPAGHITHRGAVGHVLASPGEPSSRFSLYRWEMRAVSDGPGPHFHRTHDETFIVLAGSVRLFDGRAWIHGGPGDVMHVPAGGIHGFTNTSGAPASMLMLVTPGADRGAYFAELARAATGSPLSHRDWEDLMARHDNVMLHEEDFPAPS